MKVGGKHLIIDIKNSNVDVGDYKLIIEQSIGWIEKTGSIIIDKVFHKFDNGGFSCVFLLAESHMSIHTFPEEAGISIDLFTCGSINPFCIKDDIVVFFGGEYDYKSLFRVV